METEVKRDRTVSSRIHVGCTPASRTTLASYASDFYVRLSPMLLFVIASPKNKI